MQRNRWFYFLALLGLGVASAAIRSVLNQLGHLPFNADEAVVGLMARHILEGERPIFFYGQAYMGSLDAFLVAGGFAVLGESISAIRSVQLILYLYTCAVFTAAANLALGRKAALAALAVLALGGVTLVLYTSVTLGGYNEALLLGAAQLLAVLMIQRSARGQQLLWLAFGLFAGAGFWANALTLVFTLPILAASAWDAVRRRDFGRWGRQAGCLSLGGLLGAAPWFAALFQSGLFPLIAEITGSAVAVESGGFITRIGLHFINLLLFGLPVILGLRAPWSAEWFAPAAAPVLILFWIVVWRWGMAGRKDTTARGFFYRATGGVFVLLLGLFLVTSFGADPSGRYFLPLIVLGSLWAGEWVVNARLKRWMRVFAMALVLGVNFYGVYWASLPGRPGLTTQFYAPTIVDHSKDGELIEFLDSVGGTRGYSTYWIAYPVAFQSEERVLLSPRLPYHLDLRYTPRDDRLPEYTRAVVDSPANPVLVLQPNPALELRVRERLEGLGIQWQEKQIGDYQIFYGLSKRVDPRDLGFPFP